jgi:hypothetical protein
MLAMLPATGGVAVWLCLCTYLRLRCGCDELKMYSIILRYGIGISNIPITLMERPQVKSIPSSKLQFKRKQS